MLHIAFRYGDRRLFSRFVCWWQSNDASHCELVLSREGEVFECASASYLDHGVRVKHMPLPATKWRIYRIPGDAAAARAWFEAHQGEGYDLFGLLGFAWRPWRGVERDWWCSEACAAALSWREPWRKDVADLEVDSGYLGTRVQ